MPWWARFTDWLARVFATRRRVVPREPAVMRPIGIVRNGIVQPRPEGFADGAAGVLGGIAPPPTNA